MATKLPLRPSDEPEPGVDPFADVPQKPEGPVAAAMLAGGIGALALGLATTLAEASVGVHDALDLTEAVGPLSGKTSVAVIAWLVAWLVLHVAYRKRRVDLGPIFTITLALVALGVVGTLPTFFQLFAGE